MTSSPIDAPLVLNLSVKGTPDRPGVAIRTMLKGDRYINVSVLIEHPMVAVTGTRIAKLRLGTLRRDALRTALGESNAELQTTPALKTYFKGSNGRAVSEKIRAEPSLQVLDQVLTISKLARLVGDYPSQAVARCFGLEAIDAKRWINLARKVDNDQSR